MRKHVEKCRWERKVVLYTMVHVFISSDSSENEDGNKFSAICSPSATTLLLLRRCHTCEGTCPLN